MKRIAICFLAVMLTAFVLSGCNSASNTKSEDTPAVSLKPTTSATQSAEPTKAAAKTGIVLMDVPADQKADFPVPDGYLIADTENDTSFPYALGFTLYYFINSNGETEYRAFGQNLDENGEIKEQGWYAVKIADERINPEDITSLSAGIRLLAISADEKIKDVYITGTDEIEAKIFEDCTVVRKVLELIDEKLAKPVDSELSLKPVQTGTKDTEQPSASKPQATADLKKTEDADTKEPENPKNTPMPTKENDGKIWHEAVYEEVWVVDVPASSYEEPVYEDKEIARCSACGEDITKNATAHMKEHALKGENASWRSEWVKVQTDTKTVNVPEQGHWERHLVKEAGYY